jgi:hypothetical protein
MYFVSSSCRPRYMMLLVVVVGLGF